MNGVFAKGRPPKIPRWCDAPRRNLTTRRGCEFFCVGYDSNRVIPAKSDTIGVVSHMKSHPRSVVPHCAHARDTKEIPMNRIICAAMLGSFLLLPLACGPSNNNDKGSTGDKPRLNGGGSTFVFPMMSKWAAVYEKDKGIQVNYQSIGSGGGIQKFTSKEFEFGCSDAYLNEEQMEKAKKSGGELVHIPLVLGAVVPVY